MSFNMVTRGNAMVDVPARKLGSKQTYSGSYVTVEKESPATNRYKKDAVRVPIEILYLLNLKIFQGTSQVTATYRNVSVDMDLIKVESTVSITALRCSLLRDTTSMNTLFLNLEADLFDNTKLPGMFNLNGSSLYPGAVKIDSISNTSVNVAQQLMQDLGILI